MNNRLSNRPFSRVPRALPRVGACLLASAAAVMSLSAHALPSLGSQTGVTFSLTSDDSSVSSACFSSSAAGATVVCNGSTSAPAPNGGTTITYTATATGDYGVLKAGGTLLSATLAPTSDLTHYVNSAGTAWFRDDWTITGGAGAGTLLLQFALDGSYDFDQIGTGVSSGFSLSNFSGGASDFESILTAPFANPGTIDRFIELSTGFTFGSQFSFQVTLTAGAMLFDLGLDGLFSEFDLTSTAMLNAIVVKDASGNIIPFNLATASGAALFSRLTPGIPTASVPAPGTIALLGLGLLGLAMRHRRKA